jgi:HAD superfamily hydrolase (TIGR01509 family)
MKWINSYQLFLFDFDGLLVNTEEMHHQAYVRMCAQRGFDLKWNFPQFSKAAHHNSTGLRDNIYAEFPQLHFQEPSWEILYEEKKKAFLQIVQEGQVQLMPGVLEILTHLEQANITRCVVTNSPLSFINLIRDQNPILNKIHHWITREHYVFPKPHPECYQFAINQLAQPNDRIIGFEDSPKGLAALQGTQAKAVLICPENYSPLQDLQSTNFSYYPSFNAITDFNAP